MFPATFSDLLNEDLFRLCTEVRMRAKNDDLIRIFTISLVNVSQTCHSTSGVFPSPFVCSIVPACTRLCLNVRWRIRYKSRFQRNTETRTYQARTTQDKIISQN